MRVALISDLHGNRVALDAVLGDIKRVGVDQIICLGDTATLGPEPGAVLQTLRDLGCLCIMGNHDEFLIDPELIRSYTELPVICDAVDWCRDRLDESDMVFLRGFERRAAIELSADASLLVFHGSPDSHMQDIFATTPPDELDGFLDGFAAAVMACGHTHLQMLRQHRGTLIVNPGSLGMPFKDFVQGRPPTVLAHAEYATVEAGPAGIDVSLKRVALDRGALRDAIAVTDNPLRSWLLEEYR